MVHSEEPAGPGISLGNGGRIDGRGHAVVGNVVGGNLTYTVTVPGSFRDMMATYLGLDLDHVAARFTREPEGRQIGLIQTMVAKGHVVRAAQIAEAVFEAAPDDAKDFLLKLDKTFVAAL